MYAYIQSCKLLTPLITKAITSTSAMNMFMHGFDAMTTRHQVSAVGPTNGTEIGGACHNS